MQAIFAKSKALPQAMSSNAIIVAFGDTLTQHPKPSEKKKHSQCLTRPNTNTSNHDQDSNYKAYILDALDCIQYYFHQLDNTVTLTQAEQQTFLKTSINPIQTWQSSKSLQKNCNLLPHRPSWSKTLIIRVIIIDLLS